MDVGVGSFVFSSGIVSARLLLKELHGFQRAQGAGGGGKQMKTQVSLGRRLFSTVTSSLPLFVLGFVRLAMVKSTDYAVRLPYISKCSKTSN